MKIQIAPPQALHELGRRSNQEDALFPPIGQATAADCLFLVCDGMGGHDHGEVASQTVAETIGRYITDHFPAETTLTDAIITDALAEAYNQLDARDNPADRKKMGTTLTLLCLHRGGAIMAHIGDSRIYHLRPSSAAKGEGPEGAILYQSRDHSLVTDLYLAGELRREEMGSYAGRNVITRAMQPHQERRNRPDVAHTTDLRPGDYFLLCSDGVLETVSNDQLIRLLAADATDEEKCQRLRQLTANHADNHTAYIIRILSIESEPADLSAPNDESRTRCNMVVLEREQEAEGITDTPVQSTAKAQEGWLQRTIKKLFN